jgi:2-polyprenyl-6-hydroxyphenyl methylase/3-demethylubiquinone-9 3-methyltransferase
MAAVPDNVDPREVQHYEQLAHTWWDTSGPFWPLHRLNALRSAYLRQILARLFERNADEAQPLHKLRVLDVGCGGGILSESMAKMGAHVHGIDVTDKNIVIARHHAQASGLDVHYENITVGALHQRAPGYDVVLNMEVLEHVPDVAALVADCVHLLRPGGVLVLATINRTLLSWLFAIVGAEYVLRWLARGTHRWRRFVMPHELDSFLAAGGLRIVAQNGVRVNPFNRHFSLSQRMAVNYMLVAQRHR